MGNCFGKERRVKKLREHSSVVKVQNTLFQEPFPNDIPLEVFQHEEEKNTPKLQGCEKVMEENGHEPFDNPEVYHPTEVPHAEIEENELLGATSGDADCKTACGDADNANDGLNRPIAAAGNPETPQIEDATNRALKSSSEKEDLSKRLNSLSSMTHMLDEVFERNQIFPYAIAFSATAQAQTMCFVQLDPILLDKIDKLPEILQDPVQKATPAEVRQDKEEKNTPKIQGSEMVNEVEIYEPFSNPENNQLAKLPCAEKEENEILASGDADCQDNGANRQLAAGNPETPQMEDATHAALKSPAASVILLLDKVFERNQDFPYAFAVSANAKESKINFVELDPILLEKIDQLPDILQEPIQEIEENEILAATSGDVDCKTADEGKPTAAGNPDTPQMMEYEIYDGLKLTSEEEQMPKGVKGQDFSSVTQLLDEVFERNQVFPYTVGFMASTRGPKVFFVDMDQCMLEKVAELPEIVG